MFLLLMIFCVDTASAEIKDAFVLTDDYNKAIIPYQTRPESLNITTEINLRNIIDVDESSLTLSLETTLRFVWTDDRVTTDESRLNKKGYVVLNPSEADKLWVPDIIIDKTHSIRSPAYIIPTSSIRLYKGGKIKYSARKNYDLACGMDFHNFPFDTQVCDVQIYSYGSSVKDYSLRWSTEDQARVINPKITLPQFSVNTTFIDNWDLEGYDIYKYPGVIFKIHLTRHLTYYMLQLFLPSFFLVLIAWTTMYYPFTDNGLSAQYCVQITNLITMHLMNNGIHSIIPKTSYYTYMDYWLQGCFGFIFVFIANLIVYCAMKHNKTLERIALKLMVTARVVLPILFVVFVVLYCLVVSGVIIS